MNMTKFFYSTMRGAPVLASEWGSLLDVIKTCLLTGFNQQNVASIVISDGIATATLTSNHGFVPHQVILIEGADQSEINGEHRVIESTNTTVTFATTSTGSVTGTMTVKTAPLGWTEVFTAEKKSVFRAKDTSKNRFYLRVDNNKPDGYDTSWAKFARVTIAEKMIGVDDFAGHAKAPTTTEYPNTNEQGNGVTGANGIYGWAKWYHGVQTYHYFNEANTSGQSNSLEWEIVGDDSSIYLWLQITNKDGRATYAFAPILTAETTDRFNCFLSATDGLRKANQNGEYYIAARNSASCQWRSLDTSGKFILRSYLGDDVAHATCGLFSLNVGNNQQVSGRSEDLPFPNKPDNSVVLHDIYVKETDAGIRGTLPAIKWINNRWVLSNKLILDKQEGKYLILGADYKDEGMTSFFAFELRG